MRNELGRYINGNLTETGEYFNETGLSAVLYNSYTLVASGGAVAGGAAMVTLESSDTRLLNKTDTVLGFTMTATNKFFTRTEV